MVLPEGAIIDEELEVQLLPSYTYRIDFNQKKIIGMVDELDAIKQAIFKLLETERFEHLIYSDDYAFESQGIGNYPRIFIKSEITRRITEALTQDDRIIDVQDFDFIFGSDDVFVKFTAITEYGNIDTLEVPISV
ncbi:DUF2634 domain-containing protein [Bacillus sp. FJAT-49736]|uniref:DUF2634 domain-containing protein n=1 Tax=Bacillus sp. FJAT-49736 TaxID=2833582 RepID=UPI001BC9E1A5|nr:DUF2634 domain-containing protein [Bacillus sp. FJAT-49736]MBS4172130.1 DUF2634 domain-containing protein [Bacillus sp. FJAT-49736]